MNDPVKLLRAKDILPTSQRIAVAEVVLASTVHPTADQVWEEVRKHAPTVSRATVYNTLNLFAEKGLVHARMLREGITVFDPNVTPHHHFIDDDTGEILDLPEDVIKVVPQLNLDGYDIRDIQVIVRGTRSTSTE